MCDVPLLAESTAGAVAGLRGGDRRRGAARRPPRPARGPGDAACRRARRRIAAQATDEERRELATHVVDNSGDRAQLEAQVDEVWTDLERRLAEKSGEEPAPGRPSRSRRPGITVTPRRYDEAVPRLELVSEFAPAGDQPAAIDGARRRASTRGERYQTLLGITGSGKSFTIADVIESVAAARRSCWRPTRASPPSSPASSGSSSRRTGSSTSSPTTTTTSPRRTSRRPTRTSRRTRRSTTRSTGCATRPRARSCHGATSSSSRRCRRSTGSARPTSTSASA